MAKLHVVCPACNATNLLPDDRLGDNPLCGKCKTPVFNAQPVDLNSGNFDKNMTRNDLPVLVDFWAPWCGPCLSMAPAFKEAASLLEPSVRLAKLNTEEEQNIGARFGIRSIPTMVLFRKGSEIARQSGAMATGDIVRWARSLL